MGTEVITINGIIFYCYYLLQCVVGTAILMNTCYGVGQGAQRISLWNQRGGSPKKSGNQTRPNQILKLMTTKHVLVPNHSE
jgi:hypothetical protein